MTQKELGEIAVKYAWPTKVGTSRLYAEGADTLRAIRVELETCRLQCGQVASPPQKEILFLDVTEAEQLARELLRSVRWARHRATVGDH